MTSVYTLHSVVRIGLNIVLHILLSSVVAVALRKSISIDVTYVL
jgi:hypothetical protein